MKNKANQAWPADKIERRKVAELIPYARNARTHSDAQVAQLAASIKEWGWTNPVLIDANGGLIAGHGRVLAARKLGLEEVPCMIAHDWTEAQKRAYVLADNQLALNADWDLNLLKGELDDLDSKNFNLDLIGFDPDWLFDLYAGNINEDDQEKALSENYSRKIEAPIYRITGAKPTEQSLYDDTKTIELVKEIDAAGLPGEIESFLRLAAQRHTVFNFRNIAEYYAHADAEVQDLMERSALVVIDFDKAVEQGFVDLAAAMMAEVASSKVSEDA